VEPIDLLLSENIAQLCIDVMQKKVVFFLTQAFMEKSIVRASKRNGFAAVFACGGGGAADLELEPTQEYMI
jgi:hypothetical protein